MNQMQKDYSILRALEDAALKEKERRIAPYDHLLESEDDADWEKYFQIDMEIMISLNLTSIQNQRHDAENALLDWLKVFALSAHRQHPTLANAEDLMLAVDKGRKLLPMRDQLLALALRIDDTGTLYPHRITGTIDGYQIPNWIQFHPLYVTAERIIATCRGLGEKGNITIDNIELATDFSY